MFANRTNGMFAKQTKDFFTVYSQISLRYRLRYHTMIKIRRGMLHCNNTGHVKTHLYLGNKKAETEWWSIASSLISFIFL